MLLPVVLAATAMANSGTALAHTQAATRSESVKRIQHLVDAGQLDAAEKQLWEIVTREPENAAAINLLGTVRQRQARFPEAEALFRRVLQIKPDSVDAYRSLGHLYAAQERRDDAEIAFRKALALDPGNAETSFALGKIYAETGKFERSVEIINGIPADLRPSAALPILASDYFALKQPDKVAALAPLVQRAATSDPSLAPRFARVLVDNGFVDDASELLKSVGPRQRSAPEYLLVLARIQERQGNRALAERTLSLLVKQDPGSFDARFQLARLVSEAKDYKAEAVWLERALEIQPGNIEAHRHLVLALMRSGEAAGAVKAARELHALRPEDPDGLYLLGAALANHAEWHDARPVTEKLLAVRDDATARVMLGMILINDGDIEGASRQIERALQQNPGEVEAYYYKGVVARQRGDLPGAMQEMETVVRANPQHVLALVELGTLSLQTGNLERARQVLEQAVSLQPEIPENHYQLGLAYTRLGLSDKAHAQMAKFQELRSAADRAKSAGTISRKPAAGDRPPF